MTNKDDEIFLNYYDGIKPIKKNNKITKKIKKTPTKLIEKKRTEVNKDITKNKETKNTYRLETNNKKLKRGNITINKKIDFHGLGVLDAEVEFSEIVKNCYNKNQRCILFVTGKGLHNKEASTKNIDSKPTLFYGKIRRGLLEWVKKPELAKYILSVEKAKIEHGGDGAFYVFLRRKKF